MDATSILMHSIQHIGIPLSAFVAKKNNDNGIDWADFAHEITAM
jgi:hypothetical protein